MAGRKGKWGGQLTGRKQRQRESWCSCKDKGKSKSLSFIFFINFDWHIVALQCCVNFYYTAKWISYKLSRSAVSDSLQFHEHSLPGFSDCGILQVRILEGVAIPFFKGSSVPRDQSWVSCNCGQILYCLSHQGSSSRVYFISFHFSSLKFLNKFFWCPYTSAKTFFLLSSFHQQSQVYSVKRASQHPPLRPGFSHCLTNFQ